MTIFLSHSSADKEFVTRLAFDLIERGYPVWFDMWQLHLGEDIRERITSGLQTADAFVLVISKQALLSRWVEDEVQEWLRKEAQFKRTRGRGRRSMPLLLPIKIDGANPPAAISDRLYADFSNGPYSQVLDKLVQRLRGLGFDSHEGAPGEAILPLRVLPDGCHVDADALARMFAHLRRSNRNLVVRPDHVRLAAVSGGSYWQGREWIWSHRDELERQSSDSTSLRRWRAVTDYVTTLESTLCEGISEIVNKYVPPTCRPGGYSFGHSESDLMRATAIASYCAMMHTELHVATRFIQAVAQSDERQLSIFEAHRFMIRNLFCNWFNKDYPLYFFERHSGDAVVVTFRSRVRRPFSKKREFKVDIPSEFINLNEAIARYVVPITLFERQVEETYPFEEWRTQDRGGEPASVVPWVVDDYDIVVTER